MLGDECVDALEKLVVGENCHERTIPLDISNVQALALEISQMEPWPAMWETAAMARGESSAIVEALPDMFERVKPDGWSWNKWTEEAKVSASFFTDIKNGTDPSIGRVERVVGAVGLTLVDFLEGRVPADVAEPDLQAFVQALRVAITDMPRGSADRRAQFLIGFLSDALGLPEERLATLASRARQG